MTARKPAMRIGWLLLWTCAGFLVWTLVYRVTIYSRIPLAPGDPYGIADLLEFGFGLVLLGIAIACVLTGTLLLVVPRWRSVPLALALVMVGVASVPAYAPHYCPVEGLQLAPQVLAST